MITETTIIAEPTPQATDEPSPLRQPRRRRERMEFALPTINVIFLLMLYFLIAGTIVQKDELTFAPPETARVATDRLPRPLLVVNADRSMTLDGIHVEIAGLAVAAQAALADPRAASHQLNILAPADMQAAPFLEVLASLGASGVPVRVVTVPLDTAAPK
jgi:biopolymer transport protein ExbD